MRLKDFSNILGNGVRVRVQVEGQKAPLFEGCPFLGGLKADPNIRTWWELEDREVELISTTYTEYQSATTDLSWITPIIVFWIEEIKA